MNISEAQDKLNIQAHPGIMDRASWENSHFQLFDIEDERFYVAHLCREYQIVSYDRNSPVDIRGYGFRIYVDHHRSANRLVSPGDNLESLVSELVKEASAICPHKNVTSLGSPRMHEHNYRCNDCGAEYSVDSSG